MPTFANWLGKLLGQSKVEIQRLLANKNAWHFLLAWSLFESKCFSNDLKASKLSAFASDYVNSNGAMLGLIPPAQHFHARYQNKKKLANLMPKGKTPEWMITEFKELLGIQYEHLTQEQAVKLVAFVVYRFRNNIFHGAKGVASWLSYQEQIRLCVEVLQVFVSHAEAINPTLSVLEAA